MELFSEPIALLWTVLIMAGALLLTLFSYKRRQSLMSRLGDPVLLAKLSQSEVPARRRIKTALLLSALFFALIAWAGPQWGVELVSTDTMTSHVVIAVDTSLSMLTQDVKPSRIEDAKQMLSMLVDQLGGFRIGIAAFAKRAYTQCPITSDQEALKYFISNVQAGMLPEQGTSLSDAILLSTSMLSKYPGHNAIVLLTDGEDRNKGLKDAVKIAANNGISVFAIGIGNPEGDLIPVETSSGAKEFKKDKEGKTVVSKLDEKTLVEIAAATGGAYLRYTQPEAVATKIAKDLKDLGTSKWKSRARSRYKNRFQIPLFIALLLLMAEMLVPERKTGASALRKFYVEQKTRIWQKKQ